MNLNRTLTVAFCLCCLLVWGNGRTAPLLAVDLMPPSKDAFGDDIATTIDHYIDQRLETLGVAAADLVAPEEFLRRAALDLAGRIPTPAEYRWIQKLPAASRSAAIVDHLMSLPDFEYHLRNSLDEMLLSNRPFNRDFRDYLLWAVKTRRGWDEIFRDLILAPPVDGTQKGAEQFLQSRVRDLDTLTNDTATLFFGVNIACAKCHDHPLVSQWEQGHYFGMQSFFARTFTTRKNQLSERPFGEVKFTTTRGEEKVAALTFLTGTTVEDPTPPFDDQQRKQLEEQLRRLEREDNVGFMIYPSFSPRRALVEVALQDDEDRFFAKNMVNRTWARLLGVGLVDPLDQMHDGNEASHPPLLAWLANDFAQYEYDLRRLIRGIVLSKTYARSSRWDSSDTPPNPQTFARGAVRPLTPSQLAASLLVATKPAAQFPTPERTRDSRWDRLRQEIENQAGGWAREFELPGDNFQIAVDEALFFSNNPRVDNDLLRDSAAHLVGQLKAIDDETDLIQQLWIHVLARTPTDTERQLAGDWLANLAADRDQAIGGLVWAVLTGAEARFNH